MNSALSTSSGPTDLRHGARTHLFVISTLCWDAGSAPVHVRNMSANGALVEGPILPAPGSPFVLKRGSLQVGGRIAWAASRQAGLAFSAAICVADWMARQANARQDQIDEIVSALRSAPIGQQHPNSPGLGSDRPASIETELSLLRADLMQLGNGLAADVVLVATHPEIQLLDIALQRIERIMAVID